MKKDETNTNPANFGNTVLTADFTPFSRINDLVGLEFIKTKKYKNDLEEDAKKWFITQFGAVFGAQTQCDTKGRPTWHYSVGQLILGLPNLGDFYFRIIIEMIHYDIWNKPDFVSGFDFGLGIKNKTILNHNGRDSNPFLKIDYFSHRAWDLGCLCGIYGTRPTSSLICR